MNKISVEELFEIVASHDKELEALFAEKAEALERARQIGEIQARLAAVKEYKRFLDAWPGYLARGKVGGLPTLSPLAQKVARDLSNGISSLHALGMKSDGRQTFRTIAPALLAPS
jgi:hypothetical protein